MIEQLRRRAKNVPRSDLLFGLLLTISTLFRLYHISRPPDDSFEWRQTQTLMYAASYARGAQLLEPSTTWFGVTPHVAVLEFPIFSILIHALTPVTGALFGGRLISLLCGLAALWIFDRVCRVRGHERRRTATILFAFAPLTVFYSHAIQPDALMLTLVLLAVYAMARDTRHALAWTIVAGVALSTAAVIKPTAWLTAAPPILYLGLRRGRLGAAGAVLAGAGLAMLLWAAFDRATLLQTAPAWYAQNAQWFSHPVRRLADPGFYAVLATRAGMLMLPPLMAGMVIRVAGDRAGDPIWWWWLAGAAVTALIFNELTYVHSYYELLFVPPLAALAASAFPSLPKNRSLATAAGVAFILLSYVGGRELYHEEPIRYHAGLALGGFAAAGKPVVVLSVQGDQSQYPTVLYYADRSGWNLPLSATPSAIDALPGPAPCSLIAVLDGPFGSLPTGWREDHRTSEYVLARRTDTPACN